MSEAVPPDGVLTTGPYARVGRACCAVLRESVRGTEILMVRYDRFWTLPGGGIGPGEDSASAAVRELREETGLEGRARRELFSGCWLVEVDPSGRVSIGADPEVPPTEQSLRGVAWFTLEEKHDDIQVEKVIASLAAAAPPRR